MECMCSVSTDARGWYQILRKLKTETAGVHCIALLSLLSALHLERASLAAAHSQQMLVLAPPAILAVFNTSTYRANGGAFPGLHVPTTTAAVGTSDSGVETVRGISRAALSADGRLAICGSMSPAGGHSLRVWECATGSAVTSPLAALRMPYPIRAVAWHPTQHVRASVTSGATVYITYTVFYCCRSSRCVWWELAQLWACTVRISSPSQPNLRLHSTTLLCTLQWRQGMRALCLKMICRTKGRGEARRRGRRETSPLPLVIHTT